MKISVKQDVIVEALGLVQGILSRKSALPTAGLVLIRAKDGKALIRATVLDTHLEREFDAEVQTDGEVALPGRKLFEACKGFPGGGNPVEISTGSKSTRVEVTSGKSRYSFASQPTENFPMIPSFGGSTSEIDAKALAALLGAVQYAASQSDVRVALTGVYLSTIERDDKKYVRAVATDSHRLAMCDVLEEDIGIGAIKDPILLPLQVVAEIIKMLDKTTDAVQFGTSQNDTVLKTKNSTIHFRMLDSDFPDYERVVPTNFPIVATMDRQDLIDAIARVSLLGTDKSSGVEIELKDGSTILTFSDMAMGDASDEIEAELNGNPIKFGANSKFLSQALSEMSCERVQLKLISPVRPIGIASSLTDDFLGIVMPMRVGE